MRRPVRTMLALVLAVCLTITACEAAQKWPDTFLARVEALALLQTLNADLLSHDSATLTLERWCDGHHLAAPARIVAEQVHGADKAPSAEQRQILSVSPTDTIRYRRVRLRCGEHVLSEADNWYVPARLTNEMNHVLETTDTPFGRAVQGLHFQRHTLSAKLLWEPLPAGWETQAPAPDHADASLQVANAVLEHRAVLTMPDGTPFSTVVETYTGEVLSAPPPSR